MKKSIVLKLILIILTPFLVSVAINRALNFGLINGATRIITTSEILLSLWQYILVVFWFWAGRQFAKLNTGKLKNFAMGNALWAVSFALFIWQFIFVSDMHKSFLIAGISQHYILGFVSWAAKAISIVTDTTTSTAVGILSYLMMLAVFSAGFITSETNKQTAVE